jgi:3-oxoacyl-[acyl-carrier-protein] synthase II
MLPRAVITGIGLVTPIGNGKNQFWQSATSGESGIGPITLFDTSECAVKIGGEVKDINFSEYIPPAKLRKMSRASKLAVVAAVMALSDSGLELNPTSGQDIDISMGVACMDFDTLATSMVRRRQRGERAFSPLAPGISVTSAPAGNMAMMLGITGEVTTFSTACSSSLNAIGNALRMIRSGSSKIIFAGGSDTGIQPDLMAAFSNAGSLSLRNSEPQSASRPFEAHRDGHVLSETAAIMIIEEFEHARARKAGIYAEISGYGSTNDAVQLGQVSQDESKAARCIEKTLKDAGLAPENIDFYCAHGTAGPLTDARETRMLKRSLKDHAYRLSISGIKSMTGHPFGASGALQTATCALAINRGEVPPTINYCDPDPECDLDYIPNEARTQKVDAAMCYSLGMGNNAALALHSC